MVQVPLDYDQPNSAKTKIGSATQTVPTVLDLMNVPVHSHQA